MRKESLDEARREEERVTGKNYRRKAGRLELQLIIIFIIDYSVTSGGKYKHLLYYYTLLK